MNTEENMLEIGIREKLRAACENARIVFWEDPSSEFAGDVEALELEDVTCGGSGVKTTDVKPAAVTFVKRQPC